MLKNRLSIAFLSLGLPLSAFAAVPSVAVDIAPLHSLVSQVMQGAGQPDLLIPPEASPHGYNLRPSQASALEEADVVFWMGDALTPWLEKAINNVAGSAQKVAFLELETTIKHEFREGATFEGHAHHDDEHHEEHKGEGHHDEHDGHHAEHDDHHDHETEQDHHDEEPGFFARLFSAFGSHDHEHDHHDEAHHDDHEGHDHHGHPHEGLDPHAWLDPENAKLWVVEIKEVLVKKDPDNAAVYEKNAEQAMIKLDDLIASTRARIGNLSDLKFIVFHDAYQYFEQRFGIQASGSISLSDAQDPSPARIAEIRDTVKKLGVTCVFTEPQFNAGMVENVFAGSAVAIGVMDPLGSNLEQGKSHYFELIESMGRSLSQCISG